MKKRFIFLMMISFLLIMTTFVFPAFAATYRGELTNKQTVTGTLNATGAEEYWKITVPSGTYRMHVVMEQGSDKKITGQDFDIYGRKSYEPTTTSYNFKGATDGRHLKGSGEDVLYTNGGIYAISSGTWYIKVRSYNGTGTYKLTVTLLGSGPATYVDDTVSTLNSGEKTGSYLGGDAYRDYWKISVPSNTAKMRVLVELGNNYTCDFDLYGLRNYHPDTANLDYSFSSKNVGSEDITVNSPSEGTWYLAVERWTGTGDYNIKVILTPGSSVTTLNAGQKYSGSLSQGQTKLFKITAGENLSNMRTILNCGSNNFDLYAKYAAVPTTSSYDWKSTNSTGEDYTFDAPNAGDWYIMVKATSGSGSYDITSYLNSNNASCATKYPVILAHGMAATDKMFGVIDYFWGVKAALINAGAPVYITQVNCMDSTANKAQQWKTQVEQILASTGKAKFNVIGHSHGSVYTRYAISNLGLGTKCASHTSIGGPHRGSAVADVIVGVLGDKGSWLVGKVTDYVYAFFLGDTEPNSLSNAYDVTRNYMINTFNPNTPNVSGVYYQTYKFKIKTFTANMPLWPTKLLLDYYEGDSDGLVSVSSQVWGTDRGLITGAWWCGGVDHIKEIGHFFGFTPGFSAPNFYKDVVADLKSKGY